MVFNSLDMKPYVFRALLLPVARKNEDHAGKMWIN